MLKYMTQVSRNFKNWINRNVKQGIKQDVLTLIYFWVSNSSPLFSPKVALTDSSFSLSVSTASPSCKKIVNGKPVKTLPNSEIAQNSFH